jgi:hypothetical protein
VDQAPNLALPYILAAQAQKHITHNEALRALDAVVQLAVIDRDLASPPASPANGDRYIVAASATGAWAGHDLDIAAYQDGAWAFYEPREGWIAWIADENAAVVYDGTAWPAFGGGGGGGGVASLNPATGGLKPMQVFTATGTWARPAGIRTLLVFCLGGGGGGTGAAASYAVGGGGGGGGAAIELIDVTGTASETVTIGAGGAGGSTAGGNGSTGGTSSFGAFCSATGGTGGTGQTASNSQAMTQGGAGGAGSGGLLNLTGSPGNYGSREGGTIGKSGNGGASLLGGGGLGLNGSANGNPGTSPGSGGGGCSTNSATARSGGAGADGIVWVWELE